ncbi:MAG: TetR/AcrR family transcriptional regulator [Acidobacteriia bacterium]|nr:TetR/AcrR family transcriptional regulator [Terriglobia bacterium]
MRLPAQDRRQQLIDTAMRLFSVQGFDGTTTREIAEAAGVNEAIIFRHFSSKEDLYWAVVSSRIKASGRKQKLRELIASGGEERAVLVAIAETWLRRTRKDAALSRLLFFSALRNRQLTDEFFRNYILESFDLLADYFRKAANQGSFRNVDPVVAARGFLGMIVYHNLVQELFGGKRYQQFDPHVLGTQLADLWLNGICAQTSRAKGRHGANGRNEKKALTDPSSEPARAKRALGAGAQS